MLHITVSRPLGRSMESRRQNLVAFLILRPFRVSAGALGRRGIRFATRPLGSAAAQIWTTATMSIIRLRGGLGATGGRVTFRSAREKVRSVFIIGGVANQRDGAPIHIILRRFGAQDAATILVEIPRRNSLVEMQSPLKYLRRFRGRN